MGDCDVIKPIRIVVPHDDVKKRQTLFGCVYGSISKHKCSMHLHILF